MKKKTINITTNDNTKESMLCHLDTEPHRKKGAREDMEVGPNFSLVINEASPDDEEFFTCYGHIIGNTNVQKHFFAYNWLDVKSKVFAFMALMTIPR